MDSGNLPSSEGGDWSAAALNFHCFCVMCIIHCLPDEIVGDLGEGTFGKVVECLDCDRFVQINVRLFTAYVHFLILLNASLYLITEVKLLWL